MLAREKDVNSLDETSYITFNKNILSKRLNQEICKTRQQIDICIKISDYQSISFIVEIIIKILNEIKENKKIKVRFIVDITKENTNYCKQIVSLTDEVRFSNEIKDTFLINEGTFVSISTVQKPQQQPQSSSLPNLIIIKTKSFVEQQQSFFDMLWDKSIPSSQKIKEIEREQWDNEKEKLQSQLTQQQPIMTKVLQNPDDILKTLINFYKNSNEVKFCSTVDGIKLIYNNFSSLHQEILDRYRQGNHKGIKLITSINSQKDIEVVKSFLNDGIEIRHVKDLLSINFAISNEAFLCTIEKMEEGKMVTNIMSSNDKLYLDHYDIVFKNLWKKSIDIQDRINSIEKGHYINVDVIPNPKESLKFSRWLLDNAKNEVLIILSSATAIFRVENNIGFEIFNDLASKGIKVKILIPLGEELDIKVNQIKSKYTKIEFRNLHTTLKSLIGITVIDREKVLLAEIKDETNGRYVNSIGLTLFLDGKSAALSYFSIFDSLWKQTELYYEIKKAYEKIQANDKMQKEFINTAAHELRTPIQPILGLSKIVRDTAQDNEQKEMLDIIIKNANRLKQLTEDILDVTRIEGNKLLLKKESVYLWELLYYIIKEFGHSLQNNNNNKNAKLNLYFKNIDLDTIIFVDKNRIAQVILNLLNNSLKFISKENEIGDDGIEGNISLMAEKTESNGKDNKESNDILNEIIFRVKDNGKGIDPEIYPRLFTKFASKSFQGTGLGLYISKNIIEAHGGRIWAKNNDDEKGATFSFSLPLINDTNDKHIFKENS